MKNTKAKDARLFIDPDWIDSKKNNNSLLCFVNKYPEGCTDKLIASVLCLTEYELEEAYKLIVAKLRSRMGIVNE